VLRSQPSANGNAVCPDVATFQLEAARLGYTVFTDSTKPLNLNIVGWRNKNGRPDHYDDFIAVYWPDNYENVKTWAMLSWPATTLPGKPWLLSPLTPKGAAILMPGQYRSSYQLGKYKGYPALRQIGSVIVGRDGDLDEYPDFKEPLATEPGLFGIHIHKGDFIGTTINRNSACCQVFKNRVDFDQFMVFCVKASEFWGDTFTYTLMEF